MRALPSRQSLDMEVTIPGGLPENGSVEQRVTFKELTGRMVLALIELNKEMDTPSYVSSVLSIALDQIGDRRVDTACADELCVADRQYLMLRLAARLSGEQLWLKITCAHCMEPFDVSIRRSDLPIEERGSGFPYVKLKIRSDEIEMRLPTGADQASIKEMSDREAEQHILDRCLRFVNGSRPDEGVVQRLFDDDIDEIDQALDRVSPAVCTQLLVVCPECRREQNVELNHYRLSSLDGDTFYEEIHTLAMHYHWSEDEILDMPQSRRHRYLDLISRSDAISSRV